MSLPEGAVKYTGVILPSMPQSQGLLPFGILVPVPEPVTRQNTPTVVFLPGNLQTIMLETSDTNASTYQATLDNRTVPGQVGPYATLVAQNTGNPVVTVTLPPDVAGFISITPPIEDAMALLDALLARINQWSKEGCISCSKIARAISRIMATYQKGLQSSNIFQETLDLHIYMAIIKNIFSTSAVLFGGRANEALGSDTPFIQQAAENAINSVLNADTYTVLPDANSTRRPVATYYDQTVDHKVVDPLVQGLGTDTGFLVSQGGRVNLPATGLAGELLDSITKGILVA